MMESIGAVHPDFYAPLLKNIVLHGGNSGFAGYQQRFDQETRAVSDSFINPRSQLVTDPLSVYRSLNDITCSDWFENVAVSKGMYNEVGYLNVASLF